MSERTTFYEGELRDKGIIMPPHSGGPHANALSELRMEALAAAEDAASTRRTALKRLRDAVSYLDSVTAIDRKVVDAELAVLALEADAVKAKEQQR